MQVFKTFFKVAKKSSVGILIYMGIFIVMMMILADSDLGVGGDSFSQESYRLIIEDQDGSEISQALCQYLGELHEIRQGSFTGDEITDLMYYQQIVAHITIPGGFGSHFADRENSPYAVKTVYDEALPYGIFVNMQMNSFLNSIERYMDIGLSFPDAVRRTKNILDTKSFVTMAEKESSMEERTAVIFNSLPYAILSILFSGILPVLTAFKEKERKQRALVSAFPAVKHNLMLIAASGVTAVLLFLILVGIASSQTPDSLWSGSWKLSVINVFVYTIVTTMLLSLVQSFPISGKSNVVISMLTNIIGLSFAFLGGTFVPLEFLGDGIKAIGRFTPNYWYSTAIQRIGEGIGLRGIADCLLMQLAFGIVCLTVGLAVSRQRRQTSQ